MTDGKNEGWQASPYTAMRSEVSELFLTYIIQNSFFFFLKTVYTFLEGVWGFCCWVFFLFSIFCLNIFFCFKIFSSKIAALTKQSVKVLWADNSDLVCSVKILMQSHAGYSDTWWYSKIQRNRDKFMWCNFL